MSIQVDLNDFRSIVMLVGEKKDITIFPVSKSDILHEDNESYMYLPAYQPVKLNYPYELSVLAQRIKEGIELWNKYKAYVPEEKKTFEEKYYGVTGFKNAVKGKKHISLGWNKYEGKYVTLSMPLKKGYGYINIEDVSLNESADYLDFANAVVNLINLDLSKHVKFKRYMKLINL